MRTNYDIVVNYRDIVGHQNQCSWRVRNRESVTENIDRISLSRLGHWFHNKFNDECVITVSTEYRLNQMRHKLDQNRIPILRIKKLVNM